MGSVHARGDTFLTFGLKALTETNTSRLATVKTAAIQPKTKHGLQFMQRHFVLRSTEKKLKNVALFSIFVIRPF
jgi:hypothetical protein